MSKGTRRERECAEIYQRAGFATYRPATVQYGENDVFGLFDLLAVSPDCDAVHGVQVKSGRPDGLSDWRRHTALWRRLGWRTYYAVPRDNQGWQLYDAGQDPRDARRPARLVMDETQSNQNVGKAMTEFLRP